VRMLYVLHCIEHGCPAYTGQDPEFPAGDCSGARRPGNLRTAVVVRADNRVSTAVGVSEAPSRWPYM
jgi:hypothetical protein